MRRGMAWLLLAAVSCPLEAQGPAELRPLRLTMEEAVRRALEHGEEMQMARAALAQAQGAVTQAYAEALPELRASLTYTRTFASVFAGGQSGPRLDPYSPDTTAPLSDRVRYLEREYENMLPRGLSQLFAATPFGRENTYVWQLSLRQTLFRGGVVGAGVRGARAYERAARANLEETRMDVAYRTRRAYLNALFAQRLLEIAEGSRVLSEQQLRRVELNHRVGTSADYDLLRSQVEFANTEPAVIAARNDRDLAWLELRRLANIPADTPLELDAAVLSEQESLPEVDLEALGADLASRAALEAAQWTVNFRREAVRVYRGELLPAVRFQMNWGGQAFPGGTFPSGSDFRRDWNASLTVSMPIFDGFRTRGQVAAARADLASAELQLEAAREAVRLEVEQAHAELVRARALVQARRQTVQWASRAHHLASVRYANGISTQLEVNDARLAMQQAQVNEAAATRDYLLSLAALERALGRPVPLRRVVAQVSGEVGR